MTRLLALSRAIDALSRAVGGATLWLVLLTTVISAVNAAVRKAFNVGSNAYLEVQWYLFAAVFLLGAGYTLLRNEHVRIDAVAGRFSRRTQVWIDVLGIVVFLLPLCAWVVWMSTPLAWEAWVTGEMSTNAGGLPRWPAYVLIPAGFVLLGPQAFSELIKRIAFLRGLAPDPDIAARERPAEEILLEELAKERAARGEGAQR
jgi:TRAP-type mannitol/chloroaromatic compound transport system permease small subunit